MNDPLVDREGFPRNDIDVALIRQTRHDIICLQNDLKAHMNQLEKDMQEYYKDGDTRVKMDGIKISDSVGKCASKEEIETCNRRSNKIFIKIDDVISNSPSSESLGNSNIFHWYTGTGSKPCLLILRVLQLVEVHWKHYHGFFKCITGLLTGDLVIQFGSVCADTFKDLSQIQEMIARCENKTVRVTVLRYNRPVRLNLVPKIWSGHGLLGCKVVPTVN